MLLLFAGGMAIVTKAQQEDTIPEKYLHAIAKVDQKSVTLRWAPSNAYWWLAANERGYIVERIEIPKDIGELSKATFQRLTPQPIRPWPADYWEKITESDDFAAAAYMCLYGEAPEFKQGNIFGRLKEEADYVQKRWFIAMLAADQSAVTSQALGLRLLDEDIVPQTRYLYRIFPDSIPSPFEPDTAFVIVNTAEITRLNPPVGIITVSLENEIAIKWPRIPNEEIFTTYRIERSTNPNGPFQPINETPFLQLYNPDIPEYNEYFTYVDSVGNNSVTYYYRVRGINHFGDTSPPSEVVMGRGRDLTPPAAPHLLKAAPTAFGTVEVEWEQKGSDSDLAGFIVSRSAVAEGPFTPLHPELLPPVTRHFTDYNPNPKGLNYYQITAVDSSGNISKSFPRYALFQDTFPPAPPKNLRGEIDTTGIVTLWWSPNEEIDLWGYRVYRSNAADHAFIQISNDIVLDTTFIDTITLQTLTEEIFYSVVAVDRGFGHSDYSETLKLKRPDVIAPSSGLFTQYKVDNTKVQLWWRPGSSPDAIEQRLYRLNPDSTTVLLGTFDMSVNMAEDTLTENGQIYTYHLQVMDDDSLLSPPSFPLTIRITDAAAVKPVELLSARFDPDTKSIVVTWSVIPSCSDCRYVIYRAF